MKKKRKSYVGYSDEHLTIEESKALLNRKPEAVKAKAEPAPSWSKTILEEFGYYNKVTFVGF